MKITNESGNDDERIFSYVYYKEKKMGSITDYMNTIFKEKDIIAATGCKVIWDHIFQLPELEEWMLTNKDVQYLVTNRNPIATYISANRAVLLGEGASFTDEKTKELHLKKITIDPKVLKNELIYRKKNPSHAEVLLRKNKLKYHSVIYENIINDLYGTEIKKALTFLNVDPEKSLHTNSQKVSPYTLKDSVENYEEFISFLQSNNFDEFIY